MAGYNDANGVPVPSWGPAHMGVAITPTDGLDLSGTKIRGLWVGAAGNVAVVFYGDTTNTAVVLSGVSAGTLIPIAVKQVRATNTTATAIVGLI